MPPSAANTLKRQQTVLSVSDEALKTGDKNVGAGSLHVDDDELAAAFDFFDVEGRGKLTVADLKARLGAFYKNLPSKEYKALISEPNFTKETLRALLANHELGHYRSEFEDGDDPATKRHLYRLWHRSEGGVNYDG